MYLIVTEYGDFTPKAEELLEKLRMLAYGSTPSLPDDGYTKFTMTMTIIHPCEYALKKYPEAIEQLKELGWKFRYIDPLEE